MCYNYFFYLGLSKTAHCWCQLFSKLNFYQILQNNKHIVSEEEHKEYNLLPKEKQNINNIPQIDNNSFYPQNNIDRPININISYTNENKIDNDEDDKNKNYNNKNNDNKNNDNKNNDNKNDNNKNDNKNDNNKNDNNKKELVITNNNLGNYEDNSRIKLNSDWIYGESAWTNEPDFYVPAKNNITNVPQSINEKINSDKYKQSNRVSPVMINVPWTEYKSGDSEPEPYNLK
jgi:hypothetical protein